ncbi:hypothetical protein [Thalassoroseus pseudoceratinae]|uniref:hypothetical protein n=1 Tax=Thalassoroseus pseudoceratinae TaxID=2713176 RepID=UPI0014202BCA|nr:hypothetical protein [Thalassoroseus pseudoceratinae]
MTNDRTGSRSVRKKSQKQVGDEEMKGIIREEDPPRPSIRGSTLNADWLSTVSDQAGINRLNYAQPV